jgi:hypothetical protein
MFCFVELAIATAFQRACWINRLTDCLQNLTILCFQIETFIFIRQLSACSSCSCWFFDYLQDGCPSGWLSRRKIMAAIGGGVSVAKAQRPWTVVVGP